MAIPPCIGWRITLSASRRLQARNQKSVQSKAQSFCEGSVRDSPERPHALTAFSVYWRPAAGYGDQRWQDTGASLCI